MSNLFPILRNASDSNSGLRSTPRLSSWFDDILESNFGISTLSDFNRGMTLPAVNVINNDNEFIVELAAPGLKKSDFDINLDNYVLSISTEAKTENEISQDNYTRREFGYASFKRSFSLPKTVNTDDISAHYNDGILKLILPKRDEDKKKPMREIKVG